MKHLASLPVAPLVGKPDPTGTDEPPGGSYALAPGSRNAGMTSPEARASAATKRGAVRRAAGEDGRFMGVLLIEGQWLMLC